MGSPQHWAKGEGGEHGPRGCPGILEVAWWSRGWRNKGLKLRVMGLGRSWEYLHNLELFCWCWGVC